jgi:predicted TIM-barrel fold metal-dependent hydrolase
VRIGKAPIERSPEEPYAMTSPYTTDPIRIIDVDSHLTEPPGLWLDHAPASLKDRVPRIVEREDGRPQWSVDGKPFGPIGNTLVGPDETKITGERSSTNYRLFEELHKGAYDMEARLGWLDERGIHAQVLFPNISGFGAIRFATEIEDVDLRTACVTIYNDAAATIQRESSGRLMPLALVPWWDIDQTVAELRRIRSDLGLKGITMSDAPHKLGLPTLDSPEWAPFWSECEDLDLAIAFHIGSGSMGVNAWGQGGGEAQATMTINSFFNNTWLITNLVYSGVLLRHPRLKIFSAETGIGWIPFLLEAMDYQWQENLRPEVRRDVWKGQKPTELFHRSVYVSFWFEEFGPTFGIDRIGEDNVMFETDFPHGTTLMPEMSEQVASTLANLTPEVRRKVLHDNAARLFDL